MPAELYAAVIQWAENAGRPVDAEVLALLEREADRRNRGDGWQKVLDLQTAFTLSPDAPRAEDIIRWDRDHGHSV